MKRAVVGCVLLLVTACGVRPSGVIAGGGVDNDATLERDQYRWIEKDGNFRKKPLDLLSNAFLFVHRRQWKSKTFYKCSTYIRLSSTIC